MKLTELEMKLFMERGVYGIEKNKTKHVNAPRGSRGVGIFVSSHMFSEDNVRIWSFKGTRPRGNLSRVRFKQKQNQADKRLTFFKQQYNKRANSKLGRHTSCQTNNGFGIRLMNLSQKDSKISTEIYDNQGRLNSNISQVLYVWERTFTVLFPRNEKEDYFFNQAFFD